MGRLLLAHLRRSYRLRITTRSALAPLPPIFAKQDELLVGDLSDENFCRVAVDGCTAIVHLAANAAPAATLREALVNVTMTEHLLAAAKFSKVQQIVIASSVHATGLDYRDGADGIDSSMAPRPCCPYGAGKITIEALARLHQDSQTNAVSCLRLGLTGWPLVEHQYAHTWLSARDLCRLLDAALNRAPGFGIYHAVSIDSSSRWNTKNAFTDLGWAPRDHWEVDPAQIPVATTSDCQLFQP